MPVFPKKIRDEERLRVWCRFTCFSVDDQVVSVEVTRPADSRRYKGPVASTSRTAPEGR